MVHPLNTLLQADREWIWSSPCDEAFQKAKDALVSARVLTHYDPSLPINLVADASSYGIGAVISHVCSDGTEKPIAFASRTLSASEKNYAQIEKEALALIFGVKKFHRYLYGRKFNLVTDHKPLFLVLRRVYPNWLLLACSGWAILLSAYSSSTNLRGNTAMRTVYLDFLYQTRHPNLPPMVRSFLISGKYKPYRLLFMQFRKP